MMAFIEQEANEKAEEIDAKAEEEFNIEKVIVCHCFLLIDHVLTSGSIGSRTTAEDHGLL